MSDKIAILSDEVFAVTRRIVPIQKTARSQHRKGRQRKFALTGSSRDLYPAGLKWNCIMVLRTAKAAGYFSGAKSERVGGRVSHRLVAEAKAKSGIQSQTELLEYALSKVALEDDFGKKLVARKGTIPEDVEF